MMRMKCSICQQSFVPHPRLKERQKTCGASSCRKEWKKYRNKVWREKNPDYFKGRYGLGLKEWYKKNGDYIKRYRQEHPEYVCKNSLYLRAYRQRKNGGESPQH